MARSRKPQKTPTAPKTLAAPKAAPRTIADEAEALAEVLRRHDLSEIEIERPDLRILVRRGGDGPVMMAAAPTPAAALPPPVAAPAPAPGTPPAKAETSDGNISYITSPFVGTFYRSPSPDSAPFVENGTRIKKGQVLCIVEAMKLMNEIESEVEGVVVQCLVENGHPVEYGEPLYKIRHGG
jgi:acetyl-CoA carboxylase biotin carboxyl carrier protein